MKSNGKDRVEINFQFINQFAWFKFNQILFHPSAVGQCAVKRRARERNRVSWFMIFAGKVLPMTGMGV